VQHDILCGLLKEASAEVACLPPGDSLTLDAVYTHDCFTAHRSWTDPDESWQAEPGGGSTAARKICFQLGIPILGEIRGGELRRLGIWLWLDSRTLLIGCGYRDEPDWDFTDAGVAGAKGIEVLSAPLPYGRDRRACLHLMSLMSMLDEQTVLVDLPWLAVETWLLKSRGIRLIEIEYAERDSLACTCLLWAGSA